MCYFRCGAHDCRGGCGRIVLSYLPHFLLSFTAGWKGTTEQASFEVVVVAGGSGGESGPIIFCEWFWER